MRAVLLTLAIVAAQWANAQTPEIMSQERWPDGTLRATRYRIGALEQFIVYHENGRVKETGAFRNGRREGVWKQYSDTGALLAQAGFRDGQRQGVWEFRSPGDAVIGRVTYSAGALKHGEQFDEEGQLVAMRDY
jgi:antitoxin component YwqK of YwqJK toxin-antitoxin module